MKQLTLLLTCFLPLMVSAAESSELNNLKQLQWQKRIILVFSDRVEHYQQLFNDAEAAVKDRDIAWFIIDDKQLTSNYTGEISESFLPQLHDQFTSSNEEIILIGKDGGVKQRGEALPINQLFDEIDSMPMRIREMQETAD
jgi:hypothetical protein